MLYRTLTALLVVAANVQAGFDIGYRYSCAIGTCGSWSVIMSPDSAKCEDVATWKGNKDNYGWTDDSVNHNDDVRVYFERNDHPVLKMPWTWRFQHMCNGRDLWLQIPDDPSKNAFFVFDKKETNGQGHGSLGSCHWVEKGSSCQLEDLPTRHYEKRVRCDIDSISC